MHCVEILKYSYIRNIRVHNFNANASVFIQTGFIAITPTLFPFKTNF